MPAINSFLRIRFDKTHQLLSASEKLLRPLHAELLQDPCADRLARRLSRRLSRMDRMLLVVESACSTAVHSQDE